MRFVLANPPEPQLEIGPAGPASTATVELDAHEIEDLLRKLARSHDPQTPDIRPGFQWRTLGLVALSTCWFGYAIADHVLILARDDGAADIVEPRPDNSALAAITAEAVPELPSGPQAARPDAQANLHEVMLLTDADLMEPLTFRGMIEATARSTPVAVPPAAQQRKPRRGAVRIKPVFVQIEPEQPEPQSSSLFEKLFGLRFPSS
jgi:hypothetical protein